MTITLVGFRIRRPITGSGVRKPTYPASLDSSRLHNTVVSRILVLVSELTSRGKPLSIRILSRVTVKWRKNPCACGGISSQKLSVPTPPPLPQNYSEEPFGDIHTYTYMFVYICVQINQGTEVLLSLSNVTLMTYVISVFEDSNLF